MVKKQSPIRSTTQNCASGTTKVNESSNKTKNSQSIRYERWSPDEIERFDLAHAMFGNDWVSVASKVGTRCRK